MKLFKSSIFLLLLLSVVCFQNSFAQDSTIPLADNVEMSDDVQSPQILVVETADYILSTGPQGVLVTNEEVAPRPKPAFSYLSFDDLSDRAIEPDAEDYLVDAINVISDESRSRSQGALSDYHDITLSDGTLLSPQAAENVEGRVIKGRTYIYDWNGEKLIWSHRLE